MTDWIDDMVNESTAGRYVAWAGEVGFEGAREDDRVGRTVKLRIIRPPEALREANPFSEFTRRRRGHAGTRFEGSFATDDGAVFLLEVMLLNWSDSPRGSTVTFVLPAGDGPHPFMAASRETSKWALALLERDDDEQVVDQVKRDRVENPRKGQKLSTVAAQMCKNPVFLDWIKEVYDDTVKDEHDLRDWLYIELEIESRSEIDTVAEKNRWFRGMCAEFVEWQKAKGLLR